MAQSIPLVEFGLDPLIDLNFLKLSFVQRWKRAIDNLSQISLVLEYEPRSVAPRVWTKVTCGIAAIFVGGC